MSGLLQNSVGIGDFSPELAEAEAIGSEFCKKFIFFLPVFLK
jgi:hypothetical protein